MEKPYENIKTYSGIDTLYYFCESNSEYDDLFLDILDQMEEIKGIFEKREIEYKPSDIHIKLKDIDLEHLGKDEGFYWFRDSNRFFKIGFKDKYTNRGLHDIRVQLQGEGIYTLGLPTLLKLINEEILTGYTTGNHPVTRIDYNCFIAYDLSFMTKEMFVSRKRSYSQISEIGSAKRTQTIYVGKPPFRLRLYDKRLEMKQSKKNELMREFFLNQSFDLNDELFNVEFEMHRRHLKAYNVDTVEDALANAQSLFKTSMDEIRLIDLDSISQKHIESNSKNRAKTLPIWEKIKDAYNIEDFMQNVFPVERVKRKIVLYDDDKFKEEYIQLIRKAYIHRVYLSSKVVDDYLQEAIESLLPPKPKQETDKGYIEVEQEDHEGNKENYRLLEDGTLFKPSTLKSLKQMDDYELLRYIEELSQKEMKTPLELKRYQLAYEEAVRRGLLPKIPF